MSDEQKCSICKETIATLRCSKCNKVYCVPCIPSPKIKGSSLIAKCPTCGWRLRKL